MHRVPALALILLGLTHPLHPCAASGVSQVTPATDLARTIAEAPPGQTIALGPGRYVLRGHPFVEPTCGNCEEPVTRVEASVGLLVSGRGLTIRGAGADSTIIETNAGYGILFDGCLDCVLEGVTVTGGIRDPDGRATDAAVVVKLSRVTIRDCWIGDNIGDPAVIDSVVVGVMGITGREGAVLTIEGNRIIRNSWDGIALYRGARATITGNVIDGVDRARGRTAGGGRGVGIGITWDAHADIRANLVRNYWKGIGLFVDADATVEENVVEHMLTWGISLWDAGKGAPRGRIAYNVVHDTGACGVALVVAGEDDPEPGHLRGNIISRTGQDPRYDSGEPYCLQTAIARHAVPAALTIEGNVLFENREPGDAPGVDDVPPGHLPAALAPILMRLRRWESLWGSDFLIRHGD